MQPFDKTGNVYAVTTLLVAKTINQLQRMHKQAEESILEKPLHELEADIMVALEKFQKSYPGVK